MGLFGNKSDHPMADIRSAQQLLQDVPKNDALKALLEITDWIESVRDHANFNLDHQLGVLSLLDEAARPHMRKLVREYFSTPALSKFQENRSWMALSAFFSHNEQGYFRVLTAYRNGSKGSFGVKSSLPLLTARGIYAVMGRFMISAARYEQVNPLVWDHLAQFYAHAEDQQYLNAPAKLYVASTQELSVRNVFTSVLMWYASGSASLRPIHIHLSERITSHFCKHLTLDAQLNSGSLIYFDPAHPGLPRRVTADTKATPGMRFIGAGDAHAQLEGLLKQLEKNIVPQEVNLGGVYDADVVKAAVRHLLSAWGEPPPVRRHVRRSVKVSMEVAVGFDKILGVNTVDPGFEYQFSGAGEGGESATWEVEDISATGFCCVLPHKNSEGVKIGSLIAIKPEKVAHRGVGIVRRLRRDEINNLHVGVEVLSNQTEKISLQMHDSSRTSAAYAALWLKKLTDVGSEIILLLSPHTFSMAHSMNTRLDGKGCLLIPLALLERSGDYDLARYRRVEEDADAAVDDAY